MPDPSPVEDEQLTSFHYFSRLPPELRCQIWDQVEVEPRVVKLRPIRKRKWLRGHKLKEIRCLTKAPAIVHVCRESRGICISRQRYQRAFAFSAFSTWINFDIDTISVTPTVLSWIEVDKSLVSLLYSENRPDLDHFLSTCTELREWVNLREVHVVTEDGLMSWLSIDGSEHCTDANVSFMVQRQMESHYKPDKGCSSHFHRGRKLSAAIGSR
jgi:hypothetical protein